MDARIERLIETHADRAYAIALRMSGSPADAGDIVQEAFLRVMRYAESYDPSQAFEAWLSRIIRNVYLNSLRVEARRRSVPLSRPQDDDEAFALEDVLSDGEPGPDRRAVARENSDQVQEALGTLSPVLRMTVILVDLEGMEREEAARALGCSLSALDVRLHRARAQLRETLKSLEGQA